MLDKSTVIVEIVDASFINDLSSAFNRKTIAKPYVSWIILTHNRSELITKVLDKIVEASYNNNCEIIVVDNGSNDGTLELLKGYKTPIPILLIRSTYNRGIGAGRNIGFIAARGDIIVSLDDDIYIENDFLYKTILLFEKYKNAGILAPRIVDYKTGYILNFYGPQGNIDIANHSGGCCIIRANALKLSGLIDEKCSFGAEELDLAIKIHNLGFDIVSVPELVVKHVAFEKINKIDQWERILKRLYNYSRTNFKYLPSLKAGLFSFRYFLSMARWARLFSRPLTNMVREVYRGILDGIREHVVLSERSLKYYTRDDLYPDFGNIPLYKKILNKIGRIY